MKRILIVEDDPSVQKSIQHCVQRQGHVAEIFDCVEDAESALSQGSYDLVITDFSLRTKKTGLDLLRLTTQRFPGLPVLLLSGSGETGLEHRALEMGAVRFLRKPFLVSMLQDACAAALARMPVSVPAARPLQHTPTT